ncbi:MAG: hypothetical protein CFH10_00972 [Alphaproteobacteria bacterium MarineAlpha4_Bin2]|nr:MAG: hypothetical protein CFH10_00972 [Alphaproteobacteria bacterium MarineAlpha4_Bin2]
MLFFSCLWRQGTISTLISAMAIFAATSISIPITALSAENAANVPAAFLLRCRSRGIDAERCRDGFARLKQQRGLDHARTLMSKCRLTGRDRATCQRLINASFASPNSKQINRVKAYCLRNNIKKSQCRSLMADKLGGGNDRSQQLLARCKAVGLNELECKRRLDLASRPLGAK